MCRNANGAGAGVPQVQMVEQVVPVPQISVQEVVVPVPRVMVEEVVRQVPVPQIQTVEKIVEVPQVVVLRLCPGLHAPGRRAMHMGYQVFVFGL